MSEPMTPIIRTDEDILDDLHNLVRSYDPLKMSRPYLYFFVTNGVVKVTGYVKSARVKELLVKALNTIEGIEAIDTNELYDDDSLWFQIGKLLPKGTRARIDHGRVVLTGARPATISTEELMDNVGEVRGIYSVQTGFLN